MDRRLSVSGDVISNPPRCERDRGVMVLDDHKSGKDMDSLKWRCPACGHVERRYELK